MASRRTRPSSRHAQRVTRSMNESTIGSHVQRGAYSSRSSASARGSARAGSRGAHGQVGTLSPSATSGESGAAYRRRVQQRHYIETMQHRANKRRIAVIVLVVVVLIALALLAGFLAFRGSVGSEMSLRDSDASSALVSVHAGEPYYALITAELGAVAEPLEHEGPDVLLLARVDRENNLLALVNIPPGLQVVSEGGACRIADLAKNGDAALITALSNFAKVDISHYVKIGAGGVEGIVDVLDGIEVDVDQVIDDPHAGDVYIPAGTYTLNGASALTYLRAENLKLGVSDQLDHQVSFAALVLSRIFSPEGAFATRIESIDSYFQTDLSLGDLETLHGWLRDLPVSSIACIALPGYQTEVTGVVNTGDPLYIGSSDEMAAIIASLESGVAPDLSKSTGVQAADPGSFTLEVQNGTDIEGAAGITAEELKEQGFNVVKVGNAELQVYNETLVAYKDADGQGIGRAQAVIDALGHGRAVPGDLYYTFDTDVLLIIGADYKPFS